MRQLASLTSGPPKAVAQHSAAMHECGAHHSRRFEMALTVGHIAPIVALIAGILILIMPALLNYIVALYLIVVGLVGLNDIYHFIK
jgi:hypothetical protein